jgi:hypothetical protein
MATTFHNTRAEIVKKITIGGKSFPPNSEVGENGITNYYLVVNTFLNKSIPLNENFRIKLVSTDSQGKGIIYSFYGTLSQIKANGNSTTNTNYGFYIEKDIEGTKPIETTLTNDNGDTIQNAAGQNVLFYNITFLINLQEFNGVDTDNIDIIKDVTWELLMYSTNAIDKNAEADDFDKAINIYVEDQHQLQDNDFIMQTIRYVEDTNNRFAPVLKLKKDAIHTLKARNGGLLPLTIYINAIEKDLNGNVKSSRDYKKIHIPKPAVGHTIPVGQFTLDHTGEYYYVSLFGNFDSPDDSKFPAINVDNANDTLDDGSILQLLDDRTLTERSILEVTVYISYENRILSIGKGNTTNKLKFDYRLNQLPSNTNIGLNISSYGEYIGITPNEFNGPDNRSDNVIYFSMRKLNADGTAIADLDTNRTSDYIVDPLISVHIEPTLISYKGLLNIINEKLSQIPNQGVKMLLSEAIIYVLNNTHENITFSDAVSTVLEKRLLVDEYEAVKKNPMLLQSYEKAITDDTDLLENLRKDVETLGLRMKSITIDSETELGVPHQRAAEYLQEITTIEQQISHHDVMNNYSFVFLNVNINSNFKFRDILGTDNKPILLRLNANNILSVNDGDTPISIKSNSLLKMVDFTNRTSPSSPYFGTTEIVAMNTFFSEGLSRMATALVMSKNKYSPSPSKILFEMDNQPQNVNKFIEFKSLAQVLGVQDKVAMLELSELFKLDKYTSYLIDLITNKFHLINNNNPFFTTHLDANTRKENEENVNKIADVYLLNAIRNYKNKHIEPGLHINFKTPHNQHNGVVTADVDTAEDFYTYYSKYLVFSENGFEPEQTKVKIEKNITDDITKLGQNRNVAAEENVIKKYNSILEAIINSFSLSDTKEYENVSMLLVDLSDIDFTQYPTTNGDDSNVNNIMSFVMEYETNRSGFNMYIEPITANKQYTTDTNYVKSGASLCSLTDNSGLLTNTFNRLVDDKDNAKINFFVSSVMAKNTNLLDMSLLYQNVVYTMENYKLQYLEYANDVVRYFNILSGEADGNADNNDVLLVSGFNRINIYHLLLNSVKKLNELSKHINERVELYNDTELVQDNRFLGLGVIDNDVFGVDGVLRSTYTNEELNSTEVGSALSNIRNDIPFSLNYLLRDDNDNNNITISDDDDDGINEENKDNTLLKTRVGNADKDIVAKFDNFNKTKLLDEPVKTLSEDASKLHLLTLRLSDNDII